MIGGTPVITSTELGASVTTSNLRKIGTLSNLKVSGSVNLGEFVYFDSSSTKFSIGHQNGGGLFSIFDYRNDVEIVLEGNENGRGKIGTFNNKGLDIVTGNQTRISVGINGNVVVGHESNYQTTINLFGKVGVNVKNPKEDLEVEGNIKFQNKLFAIGDRPPTDGSFQRGDIVWNSDPIISNYIGWVCTVGGAPGVWAPFGQIVG